jgi:hypothetical protein
MRHLRPFYGRDSPLVSRKLSHNELGKYTADSLRG